MNRRLIILTSVALLLSAIGVLLTSMSAQPQQVDLAELTFDENISTPAVPRKGAEFLRKHMADIRTSLAKRGYAVRLERAGEVVAISIPCSSLFAPNTCELLPGADALLRPLTPWLRYPTMYKVIIAVSSDDTGEPSYLDALTSARAEAIEEFLLSCPDVSGDALVPYGIAADIPVQDNRSIAGRAANRRAEIYIVPNWQMIDNARSGKLR